MKTVKYLDPKSDLVFKRIFGQNPTILKSFLNGLLLLPEGKMIEKIDYLPSELAPETPKSKNVIPDVRCIDEQGNRFIVEMQVHWSKNFYKRLLFGASRAYGHQLNIGEDYEALKKVIGIGLVDSIFEKEMSQWYHHYQLRHTEKADKILEDFQLLLIELPKYRTRPMADKRVIK